MSQVNLNLICQLPVFCYSNRKRTCIRRYICSGISAPVVPEQTHGFGRDSVGCREATKLWSGGDPGNIEGTLPSLWQHSGNSNA